MKSYILIILLLVGTAVLGQIDTSFTLIAKMDVDPQFELHDGTQIEVMGYTRLIGASIDVPGPTIVLEEGDSVEIKLWNFSQGARHTIHLHGLDVNQQNDGVPMLSFSIPHDSIGSYFMKVPHPGMYMYHCHETSVLHVQAGMYGMLIVKPKDNPNFTWDGGFEYIHETNWMLSEIDVDWHHDTIINHGPLPNPMEHQMPHEYNPNYFLVNGRSDQQLTDENIQIEGNAGSYTLLRLANIGYYGNRVILPAELNAQVISSDGRILPVIEETDTITILPGERFSVLLNANDRYVGQAQIDYFNLNTQEIEGTQFPKVDIDYPLSIDEQAELELNLYPNPASDWVYIDHKGKIDAIEIVDINGRFIQKLQPLSNKININELHSGIYLLKIKTKQGIISKTLTIKN